MSEDIAQIELMLLAHGIESPPWRRMPAPTQTTRCCASLFDELNIMWCGWRGRIRTFDLLIQSQAHWRRASRRGAATRDVPG
jgi:hypothetical protein